MARCYDAVFAEVSAELAMRRVAMVQTLMRDLPEEEQRRLQRLNPEEWARGASLVTLDEVAEPEAATATTPRAATRRPWWAFWRR